MSYTARLEGSISTPCAVNGAMAPAVHEEMSGAHLFMLTAADSKLKVCLSLTGAISRSGTVQEIYGAALDALAEGLGVSRSSILLFDRDGVMRFRAHHGLSDAYRAAVEGHTPWTHSPSSSAT
jgi:hypothetical protein